MQLIASHTQKYTLVKSGRGQFHLLPGSASGTLSALALHLLLPRSPAAGKASASHCHPVFFSGINSQPQWPAIAARSNTKASTLSINTKHQP
ncbi:hypothetical protein [Undibacterium pigrum]|uniref:hypothetical protein n=1 Tax=Undibacterium pigrum TaxID=401470 RepID=UPI000D764929|nr:hypothetical protein [Undibacterium pigrum]